MINKVLVLVLVFSIVGFSGSSMAKEQHGAELVITKTEGQQIKGELIAVKQSILLLLDSQSGIDVSLDIREIKEIIVLFRRSRAIEGIMAGSLVGSVAGWLIGNGMVEGHDIPVVGPELGMAMIVGLSCAVVGGLIGRTIKSETLLIKGKSDIEIKEILEKLRRQARVPDAQ